MNWQTIATAPRDRDILIWCGDGQGLAHVRWMGDQGLLVHNCGDDDPDFSSASHWLEVPEGPRKQESINTVKEEQWREINWVEFNRQLRFMARMMPAIFLFLVAFHWILKYFGIT